MGYRYRNDGRRELERFDQVYMEWYDSRRRTRRLRRRLTSDRTADILDTVDMVDLLLTKHQSTFFVDTNYKWKLIFPYLFVEPEPGDKILNRSTDEVYEVAFVEEINSSEPRPIYGPIQRATRNSGFTGLVL